MRRKPIKPGSEAAITREIREFLKWRGIFHWKVMQGLGSTPGVPDIICIINGQFVGIEVKTARGKLSDKQADFGNAIRMSGGKYIVARSVADVIDGLRLRES